MPETNGARSRIFLSHFFISSFSIISSIIGSFFMYSFFTSSFIIPSFFIPVGIGSCPLNGISTIGGPTPRYEEPPYWIQLEPMDVIAPEVDAVWGGMIAQEMQPLLLGRVPDALKPVIELQRDVFQAGLEYMKPGTRFGDLIDYVNGFGAKRGMRTLILMHGRGYGNDGPLLTPGDISSEHFRDVPVAKSNAWVWKPTAYSADGKLSFSFGGVTVVSDEGGQLVTGRQPGMVEVL